MEDKPEEDETFKPKQFHEMELDDRLLKAIARLGWVKPTLIQEKAIPLLMEGKDVLMRARTGSGKTGAFAIPMIQRILNFKQEDDSAKVRGLILAPTKELCSQITADVERLTVKCAKQISVIDVSPKTNVSSLIMEASPDIVVGTPARVLYYITKETLRFKESLKFLVVDEADVIFSFGYEQDTKEILKRLPSVYQASLASATLSEDVLQLKSLILHNAVILKLHEPQLAPLTQLHHWVIYAEEEQKAAVLYTLLKLKLLKGKTIIFVSTVDRCYKVKLFLEQFAIKSCVLNSELPAVVRCHSISQFNAGKYDIIIASDESVKSKEVKNEDEEGSSSFGHRKKDQEAGVARGIDFQCVANVVNFDFSTSVNSYLHRAGRTARLDNQGNVISLISVREKDEMDSVDHYLRPVLGTTQSIFKKFPVKLEDISGFQYRANDAWRKTIRVAVREARLKEIKQEILNSQQLKGYFQENPRDLITLRHDKTLHTVKVEPHLSHVPDYLVSKPLAQVATVKPSKPTKRKPSKFKKVNSWKKARRSNPLESMSFNLD